MNIIERVRYSRNCTNDSFPLPDPTECVEYAFTEAGEHLDADLRQRRPEHLRNNGRNVDPRREWGQVGYMLFSAQIQLSANDDLGKYAYGSLSLRQAFCLAVDDITATLRAMYAGDTNGYELLLAIHSWIQFCALSGWDIDQLIDEVCADFERKHCVVREVQ